MWLIESFLQNPVKVAVGVLLVVLFGFIAWVRMPMQLTPEVQIPTITIDTRWPGASPDKVEEEIIQRQEEELRNVEGMTKMSSESYQSQGRIILEFTVGTDMGEAMINVISRLQQVREYPEDADEPTLSTANSSDRPIAFFILTERPPDAVQVTAFREKYPQFANQIEHYERSHNVDLGVYRLQQLANKHPEFKELAPEPIDVEGLRKFIEDHIEPELERVDGVGSAEVFGGREQEIQVAIDPHQLAARELTMTQVRDALRRQNADTSGGDFWEGKRRYPVQTMGQYRSIEQVENTILARRDGRPVYVRDVADVEEGLKKPDSVVRRFGRNSLNLRVQRKTGANVIEVMEGLRERVATLNAGLLKQHGLQLSQMYDETEYIHSAVGLVWDNIIVGGILTVASLLVFLKSGRSTLILALAIPTSIIGTFLILDMMGRSLNVVSLAGLAFAVGMLMDNAIVILENIIRRHDAGESADTAATRGTQEVWGAVVASTMTTLAVFLPVLFIREEVGQLFGDISAAVSASVGLSLLVSATVVPTAAARMLRGSKIRKPIPLTGPRPFDPDESDEAKEPATELSDGAPGLLARSRAGLKEFIERFITRPADWFGREFVNRTVAINRWIQHSVTRRLAVVVGMIGASVVISWLMRPDVEYLPTGNRNLVFGTLVPPPGYSLDKLLEMGKEVERKLLPYWNVDPDSPEAENLKYPIIADFFFIARSRNVLIGLRSLDHERAAELIPLIREAAANLPGTLGRANQSSLFEQGLSAGRTVDIEIVGADLPRLVALGSTIFEQLDKVVPGNQKVPRPSLDISSPEVHLIPKWDQAADLMVTATDLGYTVDALVDGAYATDYFVGADRIDLSIKGKDQFVRHGQDVRAIPVATPSGQLVTLDHVAHIRISSGPEQIFHRESQRAITIQVSPPPEMPLDRARQQIQTQIVDKLRDAGELEGVRINLGGTADKLQQTWQSLRWNVLLALLITYLLMAALFESWLYPLVIILTVPLGAVGGLAALWVLNQFVFQPLDVLTMLGFVILIGTVVNNPTLIIHQTLNHMREDLMPYREAMLESVRNRIRPIFMTTTTNVLGLLPLVLSPGAGSELYRGVGSIVLGGMAFSTIFTLFLVPALFSLAMEGRDHFVGMYRCLISKRPSVDTVPSTPPEQPASTIWDTSPHVRPESSEEEAAPSVERRREA